MLPIFRGAATALLTPFRPDGSIDLPAWDRLLERQLDAGIAALVVCGTTGEAAALTQDAVSYTHLTLPTTCAG